MELYRQKHDLLLRFKDNETIIEQLIEEGNFEYVLKRLEQNNFLIRQIDEIDKQIAKQPEKADHQIAEGIKIMSQEIKVLHAKNIENLNRRREGYKVEALKSNSAKKPIREYTSNLR